MVKKGLSLCLVLLFIFSLSGCGLFSPQFAEYDISGYIRSLLDSSYLGKNEDYAAFAKKKLEEVEENKQVTAENGAIHFCNAFGLYPDDSQMKEIEAIMSAAYSKAKYVVKKEVKTDTGYTVDVDIEPLLTFQSMSDDIAGIKMRAESGTLEPIGGESQIDASSSSEESQVESSFVESSSEGDEETLSSESSKAAEQNGSKALDKNTLLIAHVIKLCKEKIEQEPVYGSVQTITMNILLDKEDGTLSLDTMQLDQIDETVILFKS